MQRPALLPVAAPPPRESAQSIVINIGDTARSQAATELQLLIVFKEGPLLGKWWDVSMCGPDGY